MRAMHIILHTLLFGSLVFSPPAEYPDLALECSAIENAKAMPVEMPRATAFLRSGDGGQWLEDRFDVLDLWRAESIRARWQDEEGNILSICRIRRKIPGDAGGETRTRVDYAARYSAATLGERELDALDEAVYLLSPVCVTLREAPRRSQRQNLSALWRYETTNENAFVFAFRPRAETRADADWYMVALISDDPEAEEKIDQWLDDVEWLRSARSGAPGMADGASARTGSRRVAKEAEREVRLLADDYRKNVVNYNDWHFTSVSNLVIVDNMAEADSRPFIAALTNGLPRLQAAYREMLPSPLAIDTHIAAVRIFRSRSEYLAYVGGEMKWSAALWSPQRRELVLFYPERGQETLLHTVWHEALHQHLDYACSMKQTQPWFNEGHAELFEHTHFDMDGNIVFDAEPVAARQIHANAAEFAEVLPQLFDMDYKEFYAGTDEERRLKYRLAWSLAYFLQIGAPEVRFQPFKNLRADIMSAIVRTGRRDEATRIVLTDAMRRDLVGEWLAFWKRQ